MILQYYRNKPNSSQHAQLLGDCEEIKKMTYKGTYDGHLT